MLIPVPLPGMVLKIELLRETFLVLGLQSPKCEKCSENVVLQDKPASAQMKATVLGYGLNK